MHIGKRHGEIALTYKVTVIDVALVGLILFFSIGAILYTKLGPNAQLSKVSEAYVYQGGKLFEHMRLDKDQEVILGRMLIEIKEGRIRVR
jgi:hypothetical protein